MPKFSFEDAEGECRCDKAFHFNCKSKTYADYMGPMHLVCPKWDKNYIGTHMSLNDAVYFNEHIENVKGVMTVAADNYAHGSTVVLNIGLHDSLDAPYVIRDVHSKVIEEAQRRGNVRVVCMLTPAPDEALKPEQYRESQGRRSVLAFNEKMRRFCYDSGADIMELYAPTENATSYDGTHYAAATAALTAQLFLNMLAQGSGWQQATEALGEGFLL